MDDRRKDYLNEATRVGLPHALDGSDLAPLAQDYTQVDRPETGPSSPVSPKAPGTDDDPSIESGDDLPSWSADVSDHSSWSPPEALLTPADPAPAPIPPPAAASPKPRPSKLKGSKGSSKSQKSSPSTPSGSYPSEEFDPEEMSPAKLVEEKILFNKYILRKRLGAGGMGEVWKVHHIELDCERALKFIRTGLSESPELRKRFRREARAMARVTHDNAVVIHDAFTAGGMAFIEMALVPGQSLVEILKPGLPMPLDWTVRILEQLCEVLTVAHAAGIVHRDLKPANLMLLSGRAPGRESLKVLDFGIAKLLDIEENDGASLTNNAPIGTSAYMSPEQFGTEDVGTRSDIYTVGVILFEFLTGYRPYSAKSQLYQWMQKHVHAPIPMFRDRNPEVDVPPEVEDVVRRCLAKSPVDRPQSAEDLFQQFQAASAPYLSPSRSGPSHFIDVIKPVEPPASDHFSTRVGINSSTERGIEAAEPIDIAANAALATHHQSEPPSRPELAELSTLSGGSYEWPAQETSKDAPEAVRLQTSPKITRRTDSTTLEPPAEKGRRFGLGAKLAAGVLLVGTLGAGAMLALPALVKPVAPTKPDKVDPRPPPAPPSIAFEKVPGSSRVWNEIKYDRYQRPSDNQVVFLPEGYKPSGTEEAEDHWPKVIVREDGAEFIRIVGTLAYAACMPSDPEESGPALEKEDFIEDSGKLVAIPGFYMQKFEVTNLDMAKFYEKNKDDLDLATSMNIWKAVDYYDVRPKNNDKKAKLPAVWIGIETARQYARWAGGSLPSRAQWEYAAGSQDTRSGFVWTELKNAEEMKDIAIGSEKMDVGVSPKDVTGQGLHDLGGNVREFTTDTNRKGNPVVCGGSFDDPIPPKLADCGIRARHPVEKEGQVDVGLRLILQCPEAESPGKP